MTLQQQKRTRSKSEGKQDQSTPKSTGTLVKVEGPTPKRVKPTENTSSFIGPVRDKQQQRKDTAEKNIETARKKEPTKTPGVQFVVNEAASAYVVSGVTVTEKYLKHASPQLLTFLTFVEQNEKCELIIDVSADEAGVNGHTGCYVRDPDGAEEWLLIEEAFLVRPELIRKPQGLRVEVKVWPKKKVPAVNVASTILHELELHGTHAGQLIMDMMGQGAGDGLLDLVLDFSRRPDDHLDLDHEEQYIRTAARILDNVPQGSKKWAGLVFKDVCDDALDEFASYAVVDEKADVARASAEWLTALVAAINTGGADAKPAMPKPEFITAPRGLRPVPTPADKVDVAEALGYLAERVTQRTGLLDILEEARTTMRLPVATVLDLYRNTIVPALLSQCPDDVQTGEELHLFLAYHGVPLPLVLEALATPAPSTATTPGELEITTYWPPDKPVFWLADDELEWSYPDGVPRAMEGAGNLQHDSWVLINAEEYHVMVTDQEPTNLASHLTPVYNKTLGQWVTLTRPRDPRKIID